MAGKGDICWQLVMRSLLCHCFSSGSDQQNQLQYLDMADDLGCLLSISVNNNGLVKYDI